MLGFRRIGFHKLAAVLLVLCSPVVLRAQIAPARQANATFQEAFERFASQAGLLTPLFGHLTPEQVEQLNRIEINVADENQFGQRVLDAYLQQLKHADIAVSQQGNNVVYLRQLLKTLKPLMKNGNRYRQWDVRVIEDPGTDAFSIPGGRLLVTRGLLESAISEAAVMGVLAHELSHLDRGHQLIPLKQCKLANQPLDFQDRMLWIGLIARPNRPEQESEADGDATVWMMQAGYDARELARLLNSWGQRQNEVAPWMQLIPGFVKSHPDPERRAQDVLQIEAKNRNRFPQARYVGAENLRQRTARSLLEFAQ